MNFKKYIKNIEKKFVVQAPTRKIKPDTKITEEKIKHEEKKILGFVDSDKDPYDYLKRYIKETKYKDWFNRNYPNRTIYDAVGLSVTDYIKMKRKLASEPKQTIDTEQSTKLNKHEHEQNKNLKSDEEPKITFNDFIDERELISHNAFGDKEMKIKIVEPLKKRYCQGTVFASSIKRTTNAPKDQNIPAIKTIKIAESTLLFSILFYFFLRS